jgi:hypothetical protein
VKVLHYHPDERLRDLLAAKMEIPWKKRHYHLWEHYNQKWAKLNLKKITYFFFSHLIFFFQIFILSRQTHRYWWRYFKNKNKYNKVASWFVKKLCTLSASIEIMVCLDWLA